MMYDVAQKNILLSGDVELNPGPVTNDNASRTVANERFHLLLSYRWLINH